MNLKPPVEAFIDKLLPHCLELVPLTHGLRLQVRDELELVTVVLDVALFSSLENKFPVLKL